MMCASLDGLAVRPSKISPSMWAYQVKPAQLCVRAWVTEFFSFFLVPMLFYALVLQFFFLFSSLTLFWFEIVLVIFFSRLRKGILGCGFAN